MSQSSRVAAYKQQYPVSKILNKTQPNSISLQDETDCFTFLADLTIPDGILNGLGLSLSGQNVLVAPGQWKIDGINYATLITNTIPIDAQDATYSRYDVLYVDDNNQINLISGALSLTPFEPAIPDVTIKIGSVLIEPSLVTINNPVPTDYVNTTSAQNVGGLKNFMDGIQSVTRPLADNSLYLATTEWVQNELNANAYYFVDGTFLGAGTSLSKWSVNPNQVYPSQTGNAGKFLTTDGTNASWVTVTSGGGGSVTAVSVVTANGFTGTSSGGATPALTLTLQNATTSQSGQLTNTDWNTFNTKQAALGFTPENIANKATDFTTVNNTLYPTTQAVFNFVELVNTILTGMVTTTSGTTATTSSGTYRLANTVYNITSTSTTIPAQDATLNQFSLLYISTPGTISILNSGLAANPPVPDLPSGAVQVAIILIQPGSVTVGGGGKKSAGTVTKLSATNSGGFTWTVTNPTTTPNISVTLQNATTSQSGQLTNTDWNTFNLKQAALSGTGFVKSTSGTISYDTTTYMPIGGGTFTGPITLSADAVSALQPVSYGQFLNWNNGFSWKHSVIATTTGILPAYTTSSDFLTLTATSNGAFPAQDGVTLVLNDNLLVKNEAGALRTNNGGYQLTQVGDGSHPWILTRMIDSNTSQMLQLATYKVREGTTQSFEVYTVNVDPVVLGTTQITFALTGGAGTYLADGVSLTLTGNIFSINAGYIGQSSITTLGTITTGIWHGTAIADAYISSSSNWNTAYTNRIATFTTSGNSGAATFSGNTLNIPTYTLSGLGGISGNQTITLSGDISGSGATTITTTIGASKVGISNLSATGTPSSTTYLRGDNTWATVAGGFVLPSLTNHSVLFSDGTTIAQDNSNLYYDQTNHRLSVGTAGDQTGTNTINIYGQYDAYEPQSSIGAVTDATTYPGVTASTSRGTGSSPTVNSSGDNVGGFSGWAYTGSSPAYAYMAGMSISTVGASSSLGGQLDFYTKADNGSAIDAMAISNDQTIRHYGNAGFGQLAAVSGTPGATPSITGGTLVAGTYYYKIVAVDVLGNTTTGSTEKSAVVASGTTGSVVLTWNLVVGAPTYRIYRGTASNTQTLYYTASTNTYTDTNAASTAGTVPTINTSLLTSIKASDGTINGMTFGYGASSLVSNTVIGFQAGASMNASTATKNTFIGYQAGTAATLSNNSVYIGYQAGLSITSGYNNTFIGQGAGQSDISGQQNTYIGTSAGGSSTGIQNTFVGCFSGSSCTGGTQNVFVGYAAGQNNGNATAVTAVGYLAGQSNTGNSNAFFGNSAGSANTSGTGNIFFGTSSGIANIGGAGNTYVGFNAGAANVSGSNNTFIGNTAGTFISGGVTPATSVTSSIFIGENAFPLANTQTNQIVIGQGAVGNGSNTTTIGNSSTTISYLFGVLQTPVGATASKIATVGGKIKEYYTDAGNTTTTETDLYSYTTEASLLSVNGASIQAEYAGIFISSATATRELKVYFAGTVIYDSGALSVTTSSQWIAYTSLIRVSSTVVRYMVSIVVDGVTLTSPCSSGELTGLTLSSTNILKITGQAASTGAATNDIVGKLGAVYYWPVSI